MRTLNENTLPHFKTGFHYVPKASLKLTAVVLTEPP